MNIETVQEPVNKNTARIFIINVKKHKSNLPNIIVTKPDNMINQNEVNLPLEELSKMKLIFSDRELHYKYWQEVKQEIEKL